MKQINQNPTGFTLIELMIAVAILSILTAISLPFFTRFTLKAKRTEALLTLRHIYNAEEAYYADYDRYLTNDSMGIDPDYHFSTIVMNALGLDPIYQTSTGYTITFHDCGIGECGALGIGYVIFLENRLLDDDPNWDQWYIGKNLDGLFASTFPGENGEIHCLYDDILNLGC